MTNTYRYSQTFGNFRQCCLSTIKTFLRVSPTRPKINQQITCRCKQDLKYVWMRTEDICDKLWKKV